jgi:hypothetical protein
LELKQIGLDCVRSAAPRSANRPVKLINPYALDEGVVKHLAMAPHDAIIETE